MYTSTVRKTNCFKCANHMIQYMRFYTEGWNLTNTVAHFVPISKVKKLSAGYILGQPQLTHLACETDLK